MNDLKKAAQQALEALEYHVEQTRSIWKTSQAIDALRDALEQQEQEPVAWVDEASIAWLAEHPRGIITTRLVKQKSPERQMAMYAEPPRREWQSPTENEILFATQHCGPGNAQTILVARAVESLLKEKNNG
jgi:hypothetical protein